MSALRADGKWLATFGDDGLVRIFDPELKQLVKVLAGHGAGVAPMSSRANPRRFGPMAWQPNTALLGTVSRDGSVRVWDTESGRVAFQHLGNADDPRIFSWSPDGSRLAVGFGTSGAVRLWSTSDWKELKPVDGLGMAPRSLHWSPDSKLLAIGAKAVLLYSLSDGKLQVLDGATEPPGHISAPAVRWSNDNRLLAHCVGAGVAIRDAKTLEPVRDLRPSAASATPQDFAWSPDGRQVLVGWRAGTKDVQTIYDATSGELASSLEVASQATNPRNYLEWLPDGRTAVIGNRLVDLKSQTVLGDYHDIQEWSDDGKLLVAFTTNYYTVPSLLRLDQPNKPEVVYTAGMLNTTTGFTPAWSPDGRYFRLGSGTDQKLVSFNMSGGFQRFITPPQEILSWSPNGDRTFARQVTTAGFLTWPDSKLLSEFKQPFGLRSHVWSPDGEKLLIAQPRGHSVAMVSAATGELLQTWLVPAIEPGGEIASVDWQGDRIAIGVSGRVGMNSAGHIYSATDGSHVQTLPRPSSGAWLRWISGGKQLLRLDSDATYLCDAHDGRVLREFRIGVSSGVVHLVDETTILCASPDGTVNRLDLSTGVSEALCKFAGTAVLFSPDGAFLICDLANVRRIVRVADGQTAFAIATSDLLVSPEGHLLANPPPNGIAWATAPAVKDKVVYIVQTADGQQALTPAEFASKYGWQNDPDKVRLK